MAAIGTKIDNVLSTGPYASAYVLLRDRLIARFGSLYNFEILMAALETCAVYGAPTLIPGTEPYRSVLPEIATLRADLSSTVAKELYEAAMVAIINEVSVDWPSSVADPIRNATRTMFDQLSSE